ncbi:hypothetical protein PFDG_00093 [Plasmodium falciparum Dd2]|uniref:Rifin n=1 Tax=Plasmodium falciparum (isolate Dd2) TaxID=57267 RepID=A0A0L7LX04_PLAF4|nr:hypothetical protein PFDG_00093 [Plasmodium falciparum Dd2]
MKVHYINILLFAFPLNILVNTQRNHKKIILRTPKTEPTKIHRSLCECELYAPPNYDNDPEMKEVMEIFDLQTSERFREYDERMQDKRKKCKEQCEKDIQKIILKDKIEKELTEKFSALETNIEINDIPTCVCEKSVADKVEKTCLKCGGVLGFGIAPWWGLVSALWYAGWINYTTTTLVKIATDAGIAEGLKVGLVKVAEIVTQLSKDIPIKIPTIEALTKMTSGTFTNEISLPGIFKTLDKAMLGKFEEGEYSGFSTWIQSLSKTPRLFTTNFSKEAAEVTKAVTDAKTVVLTEGTHATSSLTTAIIVSVVAIVLIVLVMVIIYLILRYRRKKKMKKKLQYIKILNE